MTDDLEQHLPNIAGRIYQETHNGEQRIMLSLHFGDVGRVLYIVDDNKELIKVEDQKQADE